MQIISRDWDYWAYLFRVVHREQIPGIEEYDQKLIAFIIAALDLRADDQLLDLASGSGVHGLKLGKRGIGVTGVDISPSLVAHANELVREDGVEGVASVVGDMREPPCASSFDAVTILSHSFGFFGPEGDLAVLRAIRAALLPGGRFLLDLNDSEALAQSRHSWGELDGGFLLSDTQYDPMTCVRSTDFRYIDPEGRVNVTQEPERIRLYSIPELTQLITSAGLELEAIYGRMALPLVHYSADCRERRLVVGRRPVEREDYVRAGNGPSR
jgi:SAM-dependent methyltransferase